MHSDSSPAPSDIDPHAAPDAHKAVVSVRTMEIAVAALFMAVSLLVIWDSVRLGHRWSDGGPEAGYFPFYIGLIMLVASASTALFAIFGAKAREAGAKPFVTWGQFRPVIAVFVPLALYVLGMQYLGLYVSAALFIGLFMRINGKYGLKKILPIALSVPVLVYVMFEKWFLVPLPKGPLEAMLGL